MRRLAIASLILPIVGAFLLFVIATGRFPQIPWPIGNGPVSLSTSRAIAYATHGLHLTLIFGPPLVGLGLALFVLFAPVFGRKRAGVTYAALGLCASTLLLLLLWAISLASWH